MSTVVEKINKLKRKRSPAYPSVDLKAAVELAGKLFDEFSEYDFSREAVCEKLGLSKSSNTYRKVAALVYYGLLIRAGNSYKISPLAKSIVLSDDETKKLSLLKKALMKPKIYTTLINENSGKSLPPSLDVRLRQLDYSKTAAKSLASIFKDSIEYAGLLINGIIVLTQDEDATSSNDSKIKKPKPEEGIKTAETPIKREPEEIHASDSYITYPLDSGIKVLFPARLIRVMMERSKEIKECLDELDKLGGEKQNGKKDNSNASDTPLEAD